MCVHVEGSGEWLWVYVLVFDKGNHVSCVVCASAHAVGGGRWVVGGWLHREYRLHLSFHKTKLSRFLRFG